MGRRIVFMGSPEFALPSLTALNEAFDVVGVITQPDRPAGRGRKLQPPAVKILAESLGLLILQPESLKDPDAISLLEKLSPDVIVVAAFGQLLKPAVLSMPLFGCVNVHASLLPRWRGAAPIQAAILNDEVTGVTIMKMDQGLDTGSILSQHSIPIPKDITAGEMATKLAHLGAELLVETLPLFFDGVIEPQPQNDTEATYAPKLTKADGELDFNQSALFLARQIQAYHPWPGTFCYFKHNPLKIIRAHASKKISSIPGKRYIVNSQPAWGTQAGLLVLDEVQPPGKARMSAQDFLRGIKDWIED